MSDLGNGNWKGPFPGRPRVTPRDDAHALRLEKKREYANAYYRLHGSKQSQESKTAYLRKWRKRNKDKERANKERWVTKSPDKRRKSQRHGNVKRDYGIGLDDVVRMLGEQDGKCGICSKEIHLYGTAHVDHDHESGHVRGLLCNACNTGIGRLKDSIHLLEKAIAYLRKHSK